jgi:hypothetical protein
MSIEAMKQALEFLEYHSKFWLGIGTHPQTISEGLRQAIEQAEQYNATSDNQLMENAQGELERVKLVQTGVGIGKLEQEPVAFIDMREWPPIRWREGMVRADVAPFDGQGLFFAPPPRQPLTDEIKDAFYEGFTSVETYNDTNLVDVDDAWKKYKAAHGIKGEA